MGKILLDERREVAERKTISLDAPRKSSSLVLPWAFWSFT